MRKVFYLFALPIMAIFLCTSCLSLMERAVGIHPSQRPDSEEGVIIDGVRWATRNAHSLWLFTRNIEDAGSLYQWNRQAGWAAAPDTIRGRGWDSSIVPQRREWEHNPCPTGWRLPTRAEFQSLLNVESSWTTFNGVYGRLFGSAPNQIFLPAVGARIGDRNVNNQGDSRMSGRGYSGHYWSSDIGSSLNFSAFGKELYNRSDDSAFSVRCVAVVP